MHTERGSRVSLLKNGELRYILKLTWRDQQLRIVITQHSTRSVAGKNKDARIHVLNGPYVLVTIIIIIILQTDPYGTKKNKNWDITQI